MMSGSPSSSSPRVNTSRSGPRTTLPSTASSTSPWTTFPERGIRPSSGHKADRCGLTISEFQDLGQLLAANGYVVLLPNPRGSTGYGQDFAKAIYADWGNKDFQDDMAIVDYAIAQGIADPEKLGVGGWSYGGISTDFIITQTTRFKAAISGAGHCPLHQHVGPRSVSARLHH